MPKGQAHKIKRFLVRHPLFCNGAPCGDVSYNKIATIMYGFARNTESQEK